MERNDRQRGALVYRGYHHYYGRTHATRHSPTVMNTYCGTGCYDCGSRHPGDAGASAMNQ
jgi:hypothetical protein